MVARQIYRWAERQPDKIAFIHDDSTFSYAAFAQNIEVVRRYFGRWALPPGDTAVIFADDFANAWFLMLGLRALGLNTVCVNSVETAERLAIQALACVVVTDAEHAAHGAIGRLAVDAPLFVFSPERLRAAAADPVPSWPDPAPRYGGHILYTSGTTGLYKKVLMDGDLEDLRNHRWMDNLSVTDKTVYNNLYLPPWTAVGFDFPACVWHVGGCVIIDQTKALFARVAERGCNLVFTTATMLGQLLKARGEGAPEAGSVRLVVGAGPLPRAVSEQARATFTDMITAIYGATEHHNCMISELASGEDAAWLKPVTEGVFDVVDEQGSPCDPGAEGQLRIRLTPADPVGYLDDDASTALYFRDGWFHPGDLATRDADGRIRILGRVGDVLNVQGRKVAVGPLEQRVQQELGVDNVCLFGALGDDGVEELVIVLETQQVPARDRMERVAGIFKPFQKIRFHVLAAFPRTEAGMMKIDRARLRKRVFGQAD